MRPVRRNLPVDRTVASGQRNALAEVSHKLRSWWRFKAGDQGISFEVSTSTVTATPRVRANRRHATWNRSYDSRERLWTAAISSTAYRMNRLIVRVMARELAKLTARKTDLAIPRFVDGKYRSMCEAIANVSLLFNSSTRLLSLIIEKDMREYRRQSKTSTKKAYRLACFSEEGPSWSNGIVHEQDRSRMKGSGSGKR